MPDDIQTNGKFITGSLGKNGEIYFNSSLLNEFVSEYLSIINDQGILKILETTIPQMRVIFRVLLQKIGLFYKNNGNITNGIFICSKQINNDTKSNDYSPKRQ